MDKFLVNLYLSCAAQPHTTNVHQKSSLNFCPFRSHVEKIGNTDGLPPWHVICCPSPVPEAGSAEGLQ
jgi:hypothetical protein